MSVANTYILQFVSKTVNECSSIPSAAIKGYDPGFASVPPTINPDLALSPHVPAYSFGK